MKTKTHLAKRDSYNRTLCGIESNKRWVNIIWDDVIFNKAFPDYQKRDWCKTCKKIFNITSKKKLR